MFIPNWVNVFGSNYIRLRDKGAKHSSASFGDVLRPENDKHYQQIMTISKTRLNALDKPSERCTNTREPDTTSCIVRHFEEELGCSINIHGGGGAGLAEKDAITAAEYAGEPAGAGGGNGGGGVPWRDSLVDD